jgi:hypothetical protein
MGQNREIALIQDFACQGDMFKVMEVGIDPLRMRKFFSHIVCASFCDCPLI